MVDIIDQFSSEAQDMFLLELDAGTKQLAKGRARKWARKQYKTTRPRRIKVGDIQNGGTTQSKIADFVPDSFARNEFRVTVRILK